MNKTKMCYYAAMEQESEGQQPKLLIISIINFFSFLDINLIIPIVALYASTLGAEPGTIGFLIGLYSITNTPMNIIAGRLIDRVGYKLPLVAGLAGGAASMFSYSLTRLPIHLAVVRAAHGICGGLKSPAVMAAFTENASESQRGKVMSFYGMSLATANLVGFGLSGVIVSRLGYQPLFLLGAAVLAVGAIMGLSIPKAERRKNPVAKASFSQDYGKVRNLLKRRRLLVSYSAIFAQYFAFGGIVTLLPLYVKNLGMDAFHVGMLLTAFTVVFIVLQFPSGILSDRMGRLKLIYAGLFLGIVTLTVLPLVTAFAALAMTMALYGAAFGLLFPSVSAMIADQTLPEERGMASGIFHALLTAGVAIGAPVMGGIGSMMGVEMGLTLSPVILVIALVMSLTIMRR
ncbi:MAG: MFS transporter [Dehalococcoidales bacterium]